MVLPGPARPSVLVLASGAGWETQALPLLAEAGITVVKRCVDAADLMAAATTGTAGVALVDERAPGLDGDAVRHLLRHDTRTIAVSNNADDEATKDRLGRLGVLAVVPADPALVLAAVRDAGTAQPLADPFAGAGEDEPLVAPDEHHGGQVVVVWGPTGAPGRTTVATSLASAWAAEGSPTVLVDLDPNGGAVVQHLGILDEVSGVLATARLANAGRLDRAAFARSARRVGDRLVVLGGLPRGDRRTEVRAGAVDAILEAATTFGDVVVDAGFGLEAEDAGPGRDRMTLDALARADTVVAVGAAEPTGLARLARGLVDLDGAAPGVPVHVVVNRMRSSLGWSERDVAGMVEGYARPASLTFLPLDQAPVDHALVAGRSVVDGADSVLVRSLLALAGTVSGRPIGEAGGRRAGVRARRQPPKSR